MNARSGVLKSCQPGLPRALRAHALKRLAARLLALAAAVQAGLCAVAGRAARRNELHELSDATLRDLGLTRSELDSCWAESEGMAEATRRRLHLFALR